MLPRRVLVTGIVGALVLGGVPAGAAEPPVLVPPRDAVVVVGEPAIGVDTWELPGDAMDVVADGEGSGYLTLVRGGIMHFRLPDEPGGPLELRQVTDPLVEARGIAIRDGVLYAVELGRFPCPGDPSLCEGGDVGAATPGEGEVAIVDAMRARVLAWDIGPDGTLGGRRTVIDEMPVVSSLHAPNGLRLGPDGWLYLPVGNVDRLWWAPERIDGHTPHQDWLGTVLRFDGSGAAPEIVASGFRNVYEVTFDATGRLWGVDNDGNAQDGYRMEELLQIKPGHRYGYPQEGTFGPKAVRDDGPLWIMGTSGTGGLAWAGAVGLGDGLLVGDCGRVSLLTADPEIPAEHWERGLTPRPLAALVEGFGGCVTSVEPVGPDRLVASVFEGDGTGALMAIRVQPQGRPSGEPTPRVKWQPPS